MLNRVGARIWIPFLMITWGIFSCAMAFIRGASDFYWVRFLLGAAEAGFYPGVVLYLQYWFPPRKVAQMNALFGCGGTLGVVIASPISGALLGRKGFFGMESWRSMFVLEALPAVLLGSAAFFLLTSRPEQASWLSEEERNWLSRATRPAEAANSGVPGESIWRGIFDLRVLMISVIYFGAAAALIVAGVWAPLMIQQLGFSPLQIGFLNSAPRLSRWWEEFCTPGIRITPVSAFGMS
jgi:ACS family tartrate transporter-like MFS transporter